MENINTPEQAVLKLKTGNEEYLSALTNNADISLTLREDTANNGQKPYAVILTCSDSRVPPEHIFSAGIGELFVVRTVGNVVNEFELGSIEYGVKHLGAKVVVIMGHTKCGAIAAVMGGLGGGYISSIVDEILPGIASAASTTEAENLNIAHSYRKVLTSPIVKDFIKQKDIIVLQAKYDIQTGKVEFL